MLGVKVIIENGFSDLSSNPGQALWKGMNPSLFIPLAEGLGKNMKTKWNQSKRTVNNNILWIYQSQDILVLAKQQRLT